MTELLLPVGDRQMWIAAIHNGADAVYVGVPEFNARGRAQDFSFDELKELIELSHLYGVKVFMAFNILIFENELEKTIDLLQKLIMLHIDAFIVQDLGLARLIKRMAPDQVVHGSTQMTVTNDLAIKCLEDLKIERFVLGREVSIPEIKRIRENTDIELEVFIHGALCVAYSGQCFTSEAIGGRSANRGQCAQSCRFDYELFVDGQKYSTVGKPYIMSPQDLMGLDQVPQLQQIGVESLKVEGRLKGPFYVASTAQAYRSVLDKKQVNRKEIERNMARVFSRGFFSGWLNGVDHQKLVSGLYPNHRGEKLGPVLEVTSRQEVRIMTTSPIKAGDGILFVSDTGMEIGGHVYESKREGNAYKIKMQKDFNLGKLEKEKITAYLNKDPSLESKLQQSYTDEVLMKRIPVTIFVKAKKGQQLEISFIDVDSHQISRKSELAIDVAQKNPATKDSISEELLKLSRSPFRCEKIEVDLENDLFIPNQVLKKMRQEIVSELVDLRQKRAPLKINAVNLDDLRFKKDSDTSDEVKITLLVRNALQLKEFLEECVSNDFSLLNCIEYIVLDFEYGRDYLESLHLIKRFNKKAIIATTRVLKPGELHNLNLLIRLNPDGILVRNLGAFQYLKDQKFKGMLLGDYSLNVSNSLSLAYLLEKGFDSICLGLDLNKWQIDELLTRQGSAGIEIMALQYMPEFHMEHCVFASCLSKGSSFRDCGKPCEKHQVSVKDIYGSVHHLAADQECRNTMFKSTPHTALEMIKEWKEAGVKSFRIEALKENGKELYKKVYIFNQVMTEKMTFKNALHELESMETYGISSGQLERKDTYINKKK